ncbi:MAG: TlpA disulfide reductase family protein [Acidobacteriota bacterium]
MRLSHALLVALALVLAACAAPEPEPPFLEGAIELGSPLPPFELDSLDDGKFALAEAQGKVTLLEFWATWCVPCHKQAEILAPLYREIDPDQVQFLAIAIGEDESTVREFVSRKPFDYPVLLDPVEELAFELGVVALPTLLIADAEGRVTYFRPGVMEADEIRDLLDEAVSGEIPAG